MLLYCTFINLSSNNSSNNVINTSLNIKNSININQTNHINVEKNFIRKVEKNIYSDLLGTISIKKISLLDKPIYKPNSKKNTIEKNITILKESIMPDNDESIIFLIAHSGTGSIAYFKNLYKLNINDKVNIKYNNIDYIYKVTNIYEDDKDGYLKIKKNYSNVLILSTCSKNKNKQLIVECVLT